MCGIGLIVFVRSGSKVEIKNKSNLLETEEENLPNDMNIVEAKLTELLRERGNDKVEKFVLDISEDVKMVIIGCLLSLRGKEAFPIPYKDEGGNILAWNGEIFGGKVVVEEGENDTEVLSKELADSKDFLGTMEGINGPYSIIYWKNSSKEVFFGRDFIGRRSLVYRMRTSIKSKEGWEAAIIVSSASITDRFDEGNWKQIPLSLTQPFEQSKSSWYELPCGEDMYSISFDEEEDVTKLVLGRLNRKSCFLKRDIVEPSFEGEEKQVDWEDCASKLQEVLSMAVKRRVTDIRNISVQEEESSICKVGILFSGGIDSMVLAGLSDVHIHPNQRIELINVSFGRGDSKFKTKDRKSAIKGLEELKRISPNPNRQWTLKEVNVTPEMMERDKHKIFSLMYPCTTCMDFNIGFSFFYAASGAEKRYRVLLSGLGADETLGGYGRHRKSFEEGGWKAFQAEIEKDISKIWKKNLGRDDRCISANMVEARFPFLDEQVQNFVSSLPPWFLSDFSQPRGFGEKRLLRQVGKRMGFSQPFFTKKKAAIHHGSKSASLTNNLINSLSKRDK